MPTDAERIAALEAAVGGLQSAVAALQAGMQAQQQIAAAFLPATPQDVFVGAPVLYHAAAVGAQQERWATARVVAVSAETDQDGVPAVSLVTDELRGRTVALRLCEDVPHGTDVRQWKLPTE